MRGCESCCLGKGLERFGKTCGQVWRVLRGWGRAKGSLERPQKKMAGACSCESCCLGKGHVAARVVALERLWSVLERPAGMFGGFWWFWGRANSSLERPQKHMAGACREGCCLGKACGRVWSVWRGLVEGGQTAALNALKNRWQGHVAARVVALEGLGALWRWQGHVAARVVALEGFGALWKGLREGFEGFDGLRAGKRQPWTPLKTDGRGT